MFNPFELFIKNHSNPVSFYVVSWISRYDDYSSSIKREHRSFKCLSDAYDFVEKLKNAQLILRNTNSIDIHIERHY